MSAARRVRLRSVARGQFLGGQPGVLAGCSADPVAGEDHRLPDRHARVAGAGQHVDEHSRQDVPGADGVHYAARGATAAR